MAEARTETALSDDLITCPICFEKFKSPKSLPCLHTYCKWCLHAYISKAVSENKPKVECPTCRLFLCDFAGQNINQWIEGLPTNFIVNSLIEREDLQTGKRNCEVCEHLGKSSTATKWCQECSEVYCEECSIGHTVHKTLRKHNLMSIKDALKGMYSAAKESSFDCPIHKNRKIELFCFDHEQSCCLTCMTVHHRKCDKVTTLEEAAEDFRNDPTFDTFIKEMNNLTSDMREEITCQDKTKRDYFLHLSKIREKAKTKKDDMVKHIEFLYSRIEEEITTVEKQQEADDQSEILTQKIMQLELLTKTLKTLGTNSSNMYLFLEFHKIKRKQNSFEEFLEQYKSHKKQDTVEFICHENVIKFDSVVSSFGEVRVVDSQEKGQASKNESKDYTPSKLIGVVTVVEQGVGFTDTVCCPTDTVLAMTDKKNTETQAEAPQLSTIGSTSSVLKEVVTIVEEGVRFTDAICLRTGTILALDDMKNTIWAYNNSGSMLNKYCLSFKPWALTAVDENQVVVTLPEKNSLQFLTFIEHSKTFRHDKTVNVKDAPRAIDFACNCLFVTFAGKVRKFKIDGKGVDEVSIPNSPKSLYGISYFNGTIIVGNYIYRRGYDLFIAKIHSCSYVWHLKTYPQIEYPLGVATDRNGYIYVSGYSSNNVLQLSPDGDMQREILQSSSGIKRPMGINLSPDGLKVILTHENKITIFEFI